MISDKYHQLEKLDKKIGNEETLSIENDMEYLLAVGQMAQFINKHSRSMESSKANSLNVIANSKTPEKVHSNIMIYFKTNKNFIPVTKRFNNLAAMVIGYKMESNEVDDDTIMFGMYSKSII